MNQLGRTVNKNSKKAKKSKNNKVMTENGYEQ